MQDNEIPAYRRLIVPDAQDQETLLQFLNEPHVAVLYEPDDGEDYFVHQPDGGILRVARCININGVQFLIPAGRTTRIPKSVFEHLLACKEEARRLRVLPNQYVNLGEIPKRR